MKLSIDRFEGAYAICQDDNEKMYAIEKKEIPNEAILGDILSIDENTGELKVDKKETKIRKEKIKSLQDKLFRKI